MGRLYLVWYWGHAIARAPKEYLEGVWNPGIQGSGVLGSWGSEDLRSLESGDGETI